MDLSLPIVDGWEATRRIKAHVELKHIPIIALSAHAMTGDEEKARKAAATTTSASHSMKICYSRRSIGFWEG